MPVLQRINRGLASRLIKDFDDTESQRVRIEHGLVAGQDYVAHDEEFHPRRDQAGFDARIEELDDPKAQAMALTAAIGALAKEAFKRKPTADTDEAEEEIWRIINDIVSKINKIR